MLFFKKLPEHYNSRLNLIIYILKQRRLL